jgi:hypothetical protein
MEHAKKLIVMDPRMIRPSMKDKSLSNLDRVISETLNGDMTDDEKAKRYAIALRNYKYYDAPPPPPPIKETIESDVLTSVEPDIQHKAKQILDRLKKNPDVKWSPKGELIYRQTLIQNSNVVDLISDILKKKTATAPAGWAEFSDGLKAVNAPREFIHNLDRWKYMNPPVYHPKKVTKSGGNNVVGSNSKKATKRKSHNWVEY